MGVIEIAPWWVTLINEIKVIKPRTKFQNVRSVSKNG